MTLRDEITAILNELSISDFHFVRLTAYEELLDRIAERFLVRGRADLKYIWLWEHFREPAFSFSASSPIGFLGERLPKDQRYWFLASDEDGKYWVADTTGGAMIQVLEEMRCFEYYIVERKLQWILCENHHGVLIQSGLEGILPAELARRDQPSSADASESGSR